MKNNTTKQEEEKSNLLALYKKNSEDSIEIMLTKNEKIFITEELKKIGTEAYDEIITLCAFFFKTTLEGRPMNQLSEHIGLKKNMNETKDIISSLLTQYHTTQNKANAKDEK